MALQEKDKLEQTLRDFERSLQKLKDCTYHEATQKQEYEKRVRAMAAELRGASLREQVRLICPLSTHVMIAVVCSGHDAEHGQSQPQHAAEWLQYTGCIHKASPCTAYALQYKVPIGGSQDICLQRMGLMHGHLLLRNVCLAQAMQTLQL